jgi:cyclophilin family peptidyl-prolyl cis-trans isomerase
MNAYSRFLPERPCMTVLRSILLAAAAALLAGCNGNGSAGINNNAVAVRTASAGTARFGEPVLITLTGRHLDRPFRTTATGCNNLALSTTAPNISTESTAYFTCSPALSSTIRFQAFRNEDGVQMADVPFTVVVPTITGTEIGSPIFIGQPLLITLQGTELQQQLNVTATGCGSVRKSTIAPHISTATTAYYRCVPTTAGEVRVVVKRVQDAVEIANTPFTVPAEVPLTEVTLTVSNGAGVSGDIVIALEPAKAPITVGNFIEYVRDGFYTDVVFHRRVPDFIIQGGGYAKTLDPTVTPLPTLKPTYGPITLEDNAGLLNLKNTIAMARTGAADSATSQFFFNLKDNPNLDRVSDSQRGYAVFGTITAGLDVLDAMVAAPCSTWTAFFGNDPGACLPNPNIVITNATWRTR